MRFVVLICFLCTTLPFFAQETLLLPYDATVLTPEQKTTNPDRLAYPTAIKETIKKDIAFQCYTPPEKCGPFSVSATKQVMFAPGNLQFNAGMGTHQCADGTTQLGTWRFAEHQWDYVGNSIEGNVYYNEVKCDNELIGVTYDGWIDLFGWGTSGWNSGASAYQPYSTNEAYSDYYLGGNMANSMIGTYIYADWGIYNAIENVNIDTIYLAGTWRTLTNTEWDYIYDKRTNASELCGQATVNGIEGFILLPDNWTALEDITFLPGKEIRYKTNTFTLQQWKEMEQHNAIFLPASGGRTKSSIGAIADYGTYWSSTASGQYYACGMSFCNSASSTGSTNYGYSMRRRCTGVCVRLAQDIEVVKNLGPFSVSDTKQVRFSSGNLQYQANNGIWRFAENQWDYVGDASNGTVYENGVKSNNKSISTIYSGWIDLFGWGTGNTPTQFTTYADDYIAFVDWGINAISNDGYKTNAWWSLTYNEWYFILFTRPNHDNLRGQATINNVHGYVLLPDTWTPPDGLSFQPCPNNWTANQYTSEQWAIMESSGAVFLPCGGHRSSKSTSDVNSSGYYWTATVGLGEGAAYSIGFGKEHVADAMYYFNYSRPNGQSVRLVQDYK